MNIKEAIDAKGYAKDIRLFAVARHQVNEGLNGLGMIARFASDNSDAELASKVKEARRLLCEICELTD